MERTVAIEPTTECLEGTDATTELSPRTACKLLTALFPAARGYKLAALLPAAYGVHKTVTQIAVNLRFEIEGED